MKNIKRGNAMKFLRYQQHNQVKPALMYHDCLYDLSDIIDDINSKNISQLSTIAKFNSDKIKQLPLLTQQITRENIINCIDEPSKIIAIGMNYLDHLERVNYLGGEKVPPKEFIFFHKPSSSITGPYCPIESPRGMQKLDYENELGVIIGKPAKRIDQSEAYQYIAGFCIINDVAERSMQFKKPGQYTMGKGCDTFCPIGPYIVTHDEINIDNLTIQTWVNGQQVQNGTTKNMIFKVPRLIASLSEYFTLQPGDIIATGTPKGVKLEDDIMDHHAEYLKPGDQIKLYIEGLGYQQNDIIEEPAA